MPKLICISPDPEFEGSVINILGRTTIGREDDNTHVLNHHSISSTHCLIEKVSSGWLLRDLMSTNGTFVDGQRIEEKTLKDSDKIRIGKLKYRFELTIATQDSITPIQVSPTSSSIIEAKTKTLPAEENTTTSVDATPQKTKIKIPKRISIKSVPTPASASAPEPMPALAPKPTPAPKPKQQAKQIKEAARHAAHSSDSGKPRKNKEINDDTHPQDQIETKPIPKKKGRGLFAILSGILFICGLAPFLKIDAKALFFFDSFRPDNGDASMLLIAPLALGFLVFLSSLIAKHLWPFLGGLFMMAIIAGASFVMFQETTPASMRATLQGSSLTANIASTTESNIATDTENTPTNGSNSLLQKLTKITIYDGNTVASALETPLLAKDDGILKHLKNKTIKDLFALQILGIIIMLGMCSNQSRNAFSSVLVRVLALFGATMFLFPLFVPLQDGSMLFGQVMSVGIALFYIPLVLIAVFCIISNMAGPTMLGIGSVLFWIGLPLCPIYAGYAAWRSDSLIPFFQYVRLLTPHYILVLMTGLAISRLIQDTTDIPRKIWQSIKALPDNLDRLLSFIQLVFRKIRIKLRQKRILKAIDKAKKIENISIAPPKKPTISKPIAKTSAIPASSKGSKEKESK